MATNDGYDVKCALCGNNWWHIVIHDQHDTTIATSSSSSSSSLSRRVNDGVESKTKKAAASSSSATVKCRSSRRHALRSKVTYQSCPGITRVSLRFQWPGDQNALQTRRNLMRRLNKQLHRHINKQKNKSESNDGLPTNEYELEKKTIEEQLNSVWKFSAIPKEKLLWDAITSMDVPRIIRLLPRASPKAIASLPYPIPKPPLADREKLARDINQINDRKLNNDMMMDEESIARLIDRGGLTLLQHLFVSHYRVITRARLPPGGGRRRDHKDLDRLLPLLLPFYSCYYSTASSGDNEQQSKHERFDLLCFLTLYCSASIIKLMVTTLPWLLTAPSNHLTSRALSNLYHRNITSNEYHHELGVWYQATSLTNIDIAQVAHLLIVDGGMNPMRLPAIDSVGWMARVRESLIAKELFDFIRASVCLYRGIQMQ
jgi:hypothetical protein